MINWSKGETDMLGPLGSVVLNRDEFINKVLEAEAAQERFQKERIERRERLFEARQQEAPAK